MPSLVQSGTATNALSPATLTPFASNTTTGNTVVLGLYSFSHTAGDVASVVSSIGTFTKVNAFTDAADGDMEWWVCRSATGAAKSAVVTCTSGLSVGVAAFEWPNSTAATDGGQATANNTAPALTVNPLVSGNVVMVMVESNTGGITAPGGAWTDLAGPTTPFSLAFGVDVAWQTVPSSSNVTATWTQPTGFWGTLGIVLAYPAAVGSAHSIGYSRAISSSSLISDIS